MQPVAGGVRELHEGIELGLIAAVHRRVDLLFLPNLLPFLFDLMEFVFHLMTSFL